MDQAIGTRYIGPVSQRGLKGLGVATGFVVIAVLIAVYVTALTGGPTPYRVPVANAAAGQTSVDLTLQTVGAIGPKLAPNPNWVSYLVRENGVWHRSTVWTLPANALVHVTLYNFDSQSGLRNPFLAQARGLVGGSFQLNGKPVQAINPDAASHTFAIPQLGVIVPIEGIADNAPKPCGEAPCALTDSHETLTFTFRTGKKGHYRWQCFVPCASGFYYGFGGPMQTIGYMDGFIDVV